MQSHQTPPKKEGILHLCERVSTQYQGEDLYYCKMQRLGIRNSTAIRSHVVPLAACTQYARDKKTTSREKEEKKRVPGLVPGTILP